MELPLITAVRRTVSTKGELSAIRSRGDIPAVIYGRGKTPETVTLAGHDYRKKGRGHSMLALTLDGVTRRVVVKDVHLHPVERDVLHLDLQEVAMNERTHVSVPLHVTGIETVEKHGGLAQQQMRELPVIGLPADIPDSFTVDISHMQPGGALHASDVPLPAGVTLSGDGDEIAVAILHPNRAVADEAASEGTPSA